MTQNLKEIFNNLAGNWSFHRKINDLKANEINKATGNASFSFMDKTDFNTLYYEENGIIALSQTSKSLNFHRKYIYKFQDDAIHIFLNDGVTKGKLFQSLIPSENKNSFTGTEHICRLDKHNGSYFFENEHFFRTKYSVIGTNTNLKIESVYQKL